METRRIKEGIKKRKNFLARLYDEKEIKLSQRGKFRFEELAGRFTVKEAIFKAIKTGWRRGVRFKDITVLNEPSGAPYVVLSGETQKIAKLMGVRNIFVSISHTKELAIGMVILTK